MADAETQARARAVWSAGNFDDIAQRILEVGRDLVERVGVTDTDRVLDVACGTGNATIPAAVAGATTTGLDIAPDLLEDGRRHAAEAGVEIEWVEGDAEQLPFEDGSFDVVLSTFGCMFAPDHERAAAEIARVLAPGGRIGIAAWTPEGAIGEFFRTMGHHGPPPPPGFVPPPMWGVRDHVSGLFEGTGVEPQFDDTAAEFRFESVDEAVEEYGRKFGPVVMLRAALEPEGRWQAAEGDLRALLERLGGGEGDGCSFEADYLLTLGGRPADG